MLGLLKGRSSRLQNVPKVFVQRYKQFKNKYEKDINCY
jgi:hypothetical protein